MYAFGEEGNMIINQTDYKLCLLDTNALTSFIQNPIKWIEYLKSCFPVKNIVVCYSIFSVCELWYRQEIFEKYFDIFSWYPSLVLDGHESILKKEVFNYANSQLIDPILISPLGIKEDGCSQKELLIKLFTNKEFIERTHYWKKQESLVLNSIIGMKKNYKPKNGSYSKKEIEFFNYVVSLEQIGLRAKEFAKSKLKNKEVINVNKFPSVKMTAYMVFYKFYPDNRNPDNSDVFDFIITSICPYIDCIITEGNVCNIINKIKRNHKLLNGIQAFSLKDIVKEINSM